MDLGASSIRAAPSTLGRTRAGGRRLPPRARNRTPKQCRSRADQDEATADTFFGWFFRGESTLPIVSGATLSRRLRVSSFFGQPLCELPPAVQHQHRLDRARRRDRAAGLPTPNQTRCSHTVLSASAGDRGTRIRRRPTRGCRPARRDRARTRTRSRASVRRATDEPVQATDRCQGGTRTQHILHAPRSATRTRLTSGRNVR